MILGDVLHGLADGQLKDHIWAKAVVATLNAILPSATTLSEESTGNQVLLVLAGLPAEEREQVLESEVNLLTGTLTLSQGAPKAEAFHQVLLKDLVEHPKNTLALVFGVVTTLALIILVITMTYNYTKHGQAPDTGLFTALIKAFIDLMNALLSTASS